MVTKVSFYLEVQVEDDETLGTKLYGPCDTEARAWTLGLDIEDLQDDPYLNEDLRGVPEEEWHSAQEEFVSVLNLIENAAFAGHGVLFKTDGSNLGSEEDSSEIPHFGHSINCETGCEETNGTVHRLFQSGDLILEGNAESDILGDYELRNDVRISLCGIENNPIPGDQEAIKK